MNIGKWRILAVSMTLICSLAIPVFAYEYFFRTPNYQFNSGIILQQYPTPTMQLGFYWDAACTQPVTIIDFGEMIHPSGSLALEKVIYLRNEGSVWNRIYWNSTLGSVSTEITNGWIHMESSWYTFYPLNGTAISAGEVWRTIYSIQIPAYATVGTYNWTLSVWGEHTY